MKTKLLKKLRRNAYLERRNNEYRAVLRAGMFIIGATSYWVKTKKEAERQLRLLILFVANSTFKHSKLRIN